MADVEEADVVVTRRFTSLSARPTAATAVIVAAALTGAVALAALGLAVLTGARPGWDAVVPPALVALVALALGLAVLRRSRRAASVPTPTGPPPASPLPALPPRPELPPGPPPGRAAPSPGSALRDPPLPAVPPPAVAVLEGGSSAGRAPWRLPVRPGPPGSVVDGGRIGGLDVRAASIVGPAHRCDDPAAVRQDAYALAQDGRRTHLVIAVADGLSSSAHSDVGARIAVSTASRELVAALDRGDPSFDARRLFAVVAGEIVGTGRERGLTERELCCLLVVAVVPIQPDPDGGRRVWTGQIGDPSVWTLGRQWRQETGPRKSGMDRNTVAAVLPFHPDAVVTAELAVPAGHRIAVVTDGVGDLLCDVTSAPPFFAARWGAAPPHPAAFLADLCVDAPGQDDDRTAVVVWCPPADGAVSPDPE